MAKRPYFIAYDKPPFVIEKDVEFKYEPGFALSQAQKTINNLHTGIRAIEKGQNVLEVSTKSREPLGVLLSAFNLCYKNTQYPLENVFQSSKVFMQDGKRDGPFRELLFLNPSEAKKSSLLRYSGNLCCFIDMDQKEWPLEPKTAYYDWIYITSVDSFVAMNEDLRKTLLTYNIFTDIAFVPEKSINCQARALAMYVGMTKAKRINYYLSDSEAFIEAYHKKNDYFGTCEQISMF